jgi:alpha-galactosidase
VWHVRLCGLVLTFLLAHSSLTRAATIAAAAGDAYVAHDETAGVWMIGTSRIELAFALDRGDQWQVRRLTSRDTAADWPIIAAADTSFTLAGNPMTLSTAGTGFVFEGVLGETVANGVALHVTYRKPDLGARVRRTYFVVPGSRIVETWLRVEALVNRPVELGDIVVWRGSVAPGTLQWLNGLRGDNADSRNDEAFTRKRQDLAVGEKLVIGSDRRSSEREVPVAIVDGSQTTGAQLVVGSLWSGAWQMTFRRQQAQMVVSIGHPGTTTTVGVGQPFESPHAMVGIVAGAVTNVGAGLREFIMTGLRGGRPFLPLVTYNTWFSYGVRIDQESMAKEIERSRDLGVELFVVDAGWYPTPGAVNAADFEAGLGGWRPDAGRFPDGLRPLRDLAHAYGIKFGLWVEPERLNISMLGTEDAPDASWLATSNGQRGSTTTAQICLGTRASRDWLLKRLTALVDEVRPDYLKWDNNFWINCDAPGHDHGARDGSFAHVRGLYDVLDALRVRYPDLLVENVSGGGNRLDFGWLRYSDSAWMDDRTAPSSHVRHNLEGLSTFFPPAYLLAFTPDSGSEPLSSGNDAALYLRSRAAGAFGLTFRSESLSDDAAAAVRDAIGLYKGVRGVLANADAILLGSPVDPADHSQWDAVEELDSSTGDAVIFAFRGESAPSRTTLRPRGLVADALYEVASADAGRLWSGSGADLMRDGIEVDDSPVSRAHVLTVLTIRQPPSTPE